MPSARTTTSPLRTPARKRKVSSTVELVYYPLVVLVFIVWVVYRSIFQFPVWFDETIGKAIFFGLPVWLFVAITRFTALADRVSVWNFEKGVLRGLAYGGLFGFAATLLLVLTGQKTVVAVTLFGETAFWWEFFLAVMTAFWETLFFFGFVQLVLEELKPKWSVLAIGMTVAAIFMVFHIPNSILRFSLAQVPGQALLLFLFALGQSLVFSKEKNLVTLVMTHAFWGMVLLVHAF